MSVNIASDMAVLPGPECEKGNHWTAVVINSLNGQILYSDSMGYPPPCELIEAMRWWLQVHIENGKFLVQELPCMEQKNSFSCSIISINGIAHHFNPDFFLLLENGQEALNACIGYVNDSIELAKRLVSWQWRHESNSTYELIRFLQWVF